MSTARGQCLFCGCHLPLLFRIRNAGFCSRAHAEAFARQQQSLAVERLVECGRLLASAVAAQREKVVSEADRAHPIRLAGAKYDPPPVAGTLRLKAPPARDYQGLWRAPEHGSCRCVVRRDIRGPELSARGLELAWLARVERPAKVARPQDAMTPAATGQPCSDLPRLIFAARFQRASALALAAGAGCATARTVIPSNPSSVLTTRTDAGGSPPASAPWPAIPEQCVEIPSHSGAVKNKVPIRHLAADMLSVCPTATSECGPKPRKVPLARSPESSASGSPPTAGGPGPAAPWDSPHQFGPLRTASSWPVLPPSNELPRLSDAPPPEVAGLVCADWSFQPYPARDSLIGRALWLPTIQPPPIRPPEHIPGHIEPARATGAPVPGFEPGRAPVRTRVLAFIAGRFGRIGRRPVLVVVAAVLAFFVAPPLISRFQAGAVSTPKAAESPVEHSLPAHPARKAAATKPRQSDPPEDRWAAFEQILAKRAGYSWNEDFRSGFDNWESPSGNLPSTWRLDETGFVMPSELGVFLPSQQMADYTMEFFGEADRRALAWAFRVRDFRNYYAAKLVISRPGPLPVISLRRYAVINGRESATRETVLPLTVRGKPALQVRMEVKGSDFSVHVQDRLVGYWSDPRIVSGGVGFFSSRGEISRIRWLHVAHQYDVLGRICAYLSPSVKASNGNRPMGVGKHGQP